MRSLMTTSYHDSNLSSSFGTPQPLAPVVVEDSDAPESMKKKRRIAMGRMQRLQRCRLAPKQGYFVAVLVCFLALLLSTPSIPPRQGGAGVLLVEAANNNYGYYGNYYNNGNGNNQQNGGGGNYQNYNNKNNNNNNNNNGNYNDDGNGGGDDQAYDDYYGNGDDGGNNYNNDDNDGYAGDDDDANGNNYNVYNNDDANDDANGDDGAEKSYSDAEAAAYANADDDVFHWNSNVGFDGVSVMPISCINYNGGQMIKFQLFDSENSYQCHFSEIATFVVSIAHYMRSYFNYQALLNGRNFELPGDAGYLNCVMLQETLHSDTPLYAKIGCVDRETFTSTKLQLHVYTDNQCSQPFDDGQTSRRHATKGYDINGYIFPTRVSFRPPFYTCDSCSPEEISDTFNKANGNWYDDYYISQNGKKNNGDDNEGADDGYGDDDGNDAYQRANDDVPRDDDAYYMQNKNNNNYGNNNNQNGDDYYEADDDDGADANGYYNYAKNNKNYYRNYYNNYNNNDDGRRMRNRALESVESVASIAAAAQGQLEAYYNEFWSAYDDLQQSQRSLYENNYDVGDWNMCQRIYKYGVWCDEECRALDFFRTDQWSASDIFLLSIMCTFVTAMMLLVVAKRLKAQQKAKIYGEEQPMPGLPPLAMALIFVIIMTVVIALAKLRFVNETLVFAVVTCILLFIYVLRLTLFESPRPVLLAAPSYFERYDDKNLSY